MRTFFVSGHRNLTEEEFQKFYENRIFDALNVKDVRFVVGDCKGADIMAQQFLKSMGATGLTTVYHMFETPMNYTGNHTLKGGYQSDVDRDFAMTLASDEDIAWVRKGMERSGTQQNLDRRQWVNKRRKEGKPITMAHLQARESNNFL